MKTEQLIAIIALPVLGYIIWRLSKWRDSMMLEDGFSTGTKHPSPSAWMDRKLREATYTHPADSFDPEMCATVIAGIVQTEAMNGSWRNSDERKIANRFRKIAIASANNPTLAQLGMLEESDIESVSIEPNSFVDFLVSTYAESKKVFIIASIDAFDAIRKEIANRFKTVVLEFKNRDQRQESSLILRGQMFLLLCFGFFASVGETRTSGNSEWEFRGTSIGARLARQVKAMDQALVNNLEKLIATPESEIEVAMNEIFESVF